MVKEEIDKRKTKNDKKAKRRYHIYKRGGHDRVNRKPKDNSRE